MPISHRITLLGHLGNQTLWMVQTPRGTDHPRAVCSPLPEPCSAGAPANEQNGSILQPRPHLPAPACTSASCPSALHRVLEQPCLCSWPSSPAVGPGCCQHLKAQLWGGVQKECGMCSQDPQGHWGKQACAGCSASSSKLPQPGAQPGVAPRSLQYPSPWLQLGFVPAQHIDISTSSSWSQPRSRVGEERAAAIFNLLDQHPATSTAASAPLHCCSTASPPHTSHSLCQPISSTSHSQTSVFKGSLPPTPLGEGCLLQPRPKAKQQLTISFHDLARFLLTDTVHRDLMTHKLGASQGGSPVGNCCSGEVSEVFPLQLSHHCPSTAQGDHSPDMAAGQSPGCEHSASPQPPHQQWA